MVGDDEITLTTVNRVVEAFDFFHKETTLGFDHKIGTQAEILKRMSWEAENRHPIG